VHLGEPEWRKLQPNLKGSSCMTKARTSPELRRLKPHREHKSSLTTAALCARQEAFNRLKGGYLEKIWFKSFSKQETEAGK
jgi:hypothetical protein